MFSPISLPCNADLTDINYLVYHVITVTAHKPEEVNQSYKKNRNLTTRVTKSQLCQYYIENINYG